MLGMGESDKATEALENAYDKFIYIDLLAKQAEEERLAEEALSWYKLRKSRNAVKILLKTC